jgi:hypothetical protein
LNLQIYSYNASVVVGYVESFYVREKYFYIIKMFHAISCAANFYDAGVVTPSRRIGSSLIAATSRQLTRMDPNDGSR